MRKIIFFILALTSGFYANELEKILIKIRLIKEIL